LGVLSVLSFVAAVGEKGVKVSSFGLPTTSTVGLTSSPSVLRVTDFGLLFGSILFLPMNSFFSLTSSSFFSSGPSSPSLSVSLSFPMIDFYMEILKFLPFSLANLETFDLGFKYLVK